MGGAPSGLGAVTGAGQGRGGSDLESSNRSWAASVSSLVRCTIVLRPEDAGGTSGDTEICYDMIIHLQC